MIKVKSQENMISKDNAQAPKLVKTKSRSEADDGSASDDHNAKAFENMDASSQELNK